MNRQDITTRLARAAAIPTGVTIGTDAFYRVGCLVGSLSDTADNGDVIALMKNALSADVTLTGRTLYKDGAWNTICLPFDVTISGSVLDGDEDEETTSLREKVIVNSEKFLTPEGMSEQARRAAAAEWYTLDGRKLSGKPTQKGVYINGGHKVVVHHELEN